MRKITKGIEPAALRKWKRINPLARYSDLTAEMRLAIREQCIQEQFGLCAYCCKAISLTTAHNEHVIAQKLAPQRSLDFANIVASCPTLRQCDAAHGSQNLPLTPLMNECELELKFFLSGRVEGLTERARQTIDVLNLGESERHNRSLVSERRELLSALLYRSGMNHYDPEDDELLQLFLEELQQSDIEQRLLPYAPVLINVIRHQLSNHIGNDI